MRDDGSGNGSGNGNGGGNGNGTRERHWLDRQLLHVNLACIGLYALRCILRVLSDGHMPWAHTLAAPLFSNLAMLIFVMLAGTLLFFFWSRITAERARGYLCLTASMILAIMLLRFLKYNGFDPHLQPAMALTWYGYYVCLMFASVGLFLASLYCFPKIARPIPREWRLLLPAAGLLGALCMTNDLHQQLFRIREFFPENGSFDYGYGPLYIVVIAFCGILLLGSMGILIHHGSGRQWRSRIWLPVLWLAVLLLYVPLNMSGFIGSHFWLNAVLKMPEVVSFCCCMVVVNCVLIGLIPSNLGYAALLGHSSVPLLITDQGDEPFMRSDHAWLEELSDDVRLHARLEGSSPLAQDANGLLRCFPVNGGTAYYVDDLSAVKQANERLEELAEQLTDETSIIQADLALRRQLARTQEQTRIYEQLSQVMEPRLGSMELTLGDAAEAGVDTRAATDVHHDLARACVTGAYIKRRVNLALLAYDSERLSPVELELALRESCEYLELYGASCSLSSNRSTTAIDGQLLILAYDLFEAAIDAALPGLRAVMIDQYVDRDLLMLKLVLDGGSDDLPADWEADRIDAVGGRLDLTHEDESFFVRLGLPLGAESL